MDILFYIYTRLYIIDYAYRIDYYSDNINIFQFLNIENLAFSHFGRNKEAGRMIEPVILQGNPFFNCIYTNVYIH